MDPVGPWSAYAASYNRLANASSFQNAGGSDLHHPMGGGVQAPPSSTSQLLAAHATAASPFNPPGFLSPPPVAYDPVFTPLFHQKAHYGIQHRPIKQPENDPYNQMTPNNFYDQNSGPSVWSQNSAQLPSPFGILPHESVVPNSPGSSSKSYDNYNPHFSAQSLNQLSDYKNSSFIDPKKRSFSPPKSITSAAPFFQQMLTPPSDSSSSYKQNDYSVKHYQNGHVQPAYNVSSPPQEKEYRIPQPPRPPFPQQRSEKPRAYTPKQNAQKQHNKIYEAEKHGEIESQSSPISYAMIDSQRSYQNSKLRSLQFQHVQNQQAYRFPMTPESDYQRSKSTESFGSTSSNPDCHIGLPRRPSPLHAQQSPTAPSPVYPIYNSPLTTISSPSPVHHESCYNKQQNEVPPPLDVTLPRGSVSNSVISRIDGRCERQDYSRQQWDERQRKYSGYDSQTGQYRQQYFDPAHQSNLQDFSSCRGDPMSLVKTLQQQQPERNPEEKMKKRKKISDKTSEQEYFDRVPPPAHHNANQAGQNGYFDFDRWNLAAATSKVYPATMAGGSTIIDSQPQPLMVSHAGASTNYFPSLPTPQSQPAEPSDSAEIPQVQTKVIVPNIEDELQCLLENVNTENDLARTRQTICSQSGFMSSFIKFVQGERESSPTPDTYQPKKTKIYNSSERTNDVPIVAPIPEFPSDPQDDPRYFPLPKSSDKRKFDSSDTDASCNEHTSEKPVTNIESPHPPLPLAPPQPEEKQQPKHIKKKEKNRHKNKKKKKSRKQDSPKAVVPRREMSKRKAKEKSVSLIDEAEMDSDSDPSWSPDYVDSDEEGNRKRRMRLVLSRWKPTSQPEETTNDEDIPLSERTKKKVKRKTNSSGRRKSGSVKKKLTPHIIYPSKMTGSKSNYFPFNIGEFVILRSDQNLRHPPLWRVKEKAMLQKFQHYVLNGKSFYQHLSFYTGWSPERRNVYEGVAVKVVSMTKTNMIVQLISTDNYFIVPKDKPIVDRTVENMEKHQVNFEVYVQTLFSQALDSNFLNEIFQEEDEYFLLNVSAIDSLISDLEQRFVEAIDWPKDLTASIQKYWSYKCQPKGGVDCHCGAQGIQDVILSGVSYNKDTLCPEQEDEPISTFQIVLCRECMFILEMLYKLSHFKCFLYAICEEKAIEEKDANPTRDSTALLNKLLADAKWFNKLYKSVCTDWGCAEALIEKLKTNKKSSEP